LRCHPIMAASGVRSNADTKVRIEKQLRFFYEINGTSTVNKLIVSIRVVVLLMILNGCEKNSGEGVVLAKELIDAAPANAETPKAQPDSSPDVEIRPMADDEIAVDGYVMKPEVRGTSRDPRALQHEQCLVKVRMLDNGRTFQVQVDRAKWEKLHENDRVRVRY